MPEPVKKKTAKGRKSSQPKRMRYVLEHRGERRKKMQFLKHCEKHPNDKQAQGLRGK